MKTLQKIGTASISIFMLSFCVLFLNSIFGWDGNIEGMSITARYGLYICGVSATTMVLSYALGGLIKK